MGIATVWKEYRLVAEDNGGLVRLEDYDGEIEEEWQEAKGVKIFDRDGEEVGTVEDLYVWASAEAVHLIKAQVGESHVLIPTDAATNASEEGVEVEQDKSVILESPEHDSDDVPDPDTVRAAFEHFGYSDPLSLGG